MARRSEIVKGQSGGLKQAVALAALRTLTSQPPPRVRSFSANTSRIGRLASVQQNTTPIIVTPPAPSEPWLAWTDYYAWIDAANPLSLWTTSGRTANPAANGDAVGAADVFTADRVTDFDNVNFNNGDWKYDDGTGAEAINGKPTLYYDGLQGVNTGNCAKSATAYLDGSLGFTLHMVFQLRTGWASGSGLYDMGGNDHELRVETTGGGRFFLRGFLTGYTARYAAIPDPTEPHVLTVRRAAGSGNLYVYVDGVLVITHNASGVLSSGSPAPYCRAHQRCPLSIITAGDDPDYAAKITDLMDYFGIV